MRAHKSILLDSTEYIANDSAEAKEHIKNVENGLLPAIHVKGSESTRYSIRERMSHYRIPGVSVAVINNGEIEWAKGYGVKENRADDPVTVATLFQAASISKPVVAVAVLRLVEKNMISLDSPVNTQLKSWKIPDNEFTRKKPVTVEMLLTHTGGVTGFGFEGYRAGDRLPTLIQVLDGLKPAVSPPIRIVHEPGSRWLYSNGGYLILQQLLMDVTDLTFPELMDEIILEPLSMGDSSFSQPLKPGHEKMFASGHKPDGTVVEGKWRVFPEMAAGGLWTNPVDLCRVIIEVQRSLIGRSNRVLSRSMTENMLSRHFENMGLGFVLRGGGEDLGFTFSGGNEGYRCDMFAYTSRGRGAVIMTNSDNGQFLIDELFRGISAEYGWPDYKPRIKEVARIGEKLYDEYVGTYHSRQTIRPDFDINVEKADDHLCVSFMGGRYLFLPESEQRFFVVDHGWEIEFLRGEDGKVEGIRYFLIVGPGTAQRID
jgi:CubicO group peptidase (beta-lactamase class C family)